MALPGGGDESQSPLLGVGVAADREDPEEEPGPALERAGGDGTVQLWQELAAEGARRVRHGSAVSLADVVEGVSELPIEQPLRLLDSAGVLLAIGTRAKHEAIRPVVVLQPAGSSQPRKPSEPSALQAKDRVV